MDQTRVIEVKKNILAANDEAADAFRAARAQEGTFFVDVMASPGAGKTTLLLASCVPGASRPSASSRPTWNPTWTPSRSRRPASPPWS